MPNHITNTLTITGDINKINEVLNFIKSEDASETGKSGIGTIDFNKIIPMPEHIYKGDLSSKEIEKYGKENCWYDWSIKNWGTKWNAYSQRNEGNTIYFKTAWSGVPDIIRKLASIFPDITLEYEYYDEDFGYNVASYKFENSKEESFIPKGGTKEAYELAIKISGHKPEYLVYNENVGNYVYVD